MGNKIIETDHYKVVITDSKNEVLSKFDDKNDEKFTVNLTKEVEGKTTIYLNSDYYNTPEALEYGAAQCILRKEMNRTAFLELTEEDVDLRGQVIGEELVDILKQLR